MFKSLVMSLGAILLCTAVAAAKSSGPATTTVTATIQGTGSAATGANTGADGQCVNTGDPWIDDYTCSGAGNCECNVDYVAYGLRRRPQNGN